MVTADIPCRFRIPWLQVTKDFQRGPRLQADSCGALTAGKPPAPPGPLIQEPPATGRPLIRVSIPIVLHLSLNLSATLPSPFTLHPVARGGRHQPRRHVVTCSAAALVLPTEKTLKGAGPVCPPSRGNGNGVARAPLQGPATSPQSLSLSPSRDAARPDEHRRLLFLILGTPNICRFIFKF